MVFLLTILGCQGDTGDSDATDTDGLQFSPVLSCTEPVSLSWTAIGEDMDGHEDPDADHVNGGGLIVEDFDGDDHIDLIIFFHNSPPTLYRGDGAGGFVEAERWPALIGAPSLLDLNLDGDLDILLATGNALLADGAGSFVIPEGEGIDLKGVSLLPDDFNNDPDSSHPAKTRLRCCRAGAGVVRAWRRTDRRSDHHHHP